MTFKTYKDLKNSGVAWLGDVPAHWEIKKLKYLCTFVGGGTPSKDVSEYWNGDIPWVSPKDMKLEEVTKSEDMISKSGLENSPVSLVPVRRQNNRDGLRRLLTEASAHLGL